MTSIHIRLTDTLIEKDKVILLYYILSIMLVAKESFIVVVLQGLKAAKIQWLKLVSQMRGERKNNNVMCMAKPKKLPRLVAVMAI